ncbi:putative signal transduction protein with CBS domains [Ferroglobus placidus DSM 10642]|uniref:Putative signal transduction protein with CBS domains n=1 Tax=Ferroglobus placidus (strain DSM 10642 / AEDII12DO) TaxID=589924 RepID=D3RYB8_FERPA|nr:CBS domain-containing protein [Ferroglobus placidus]ADC65481.1 putative signal transduction protein with CBS domains [Ferroglobus placidus DSM 10642]
MSYLGAKIGDEVKKEKKSPVKPGSVMEIATKNVITIPPTSTIMSAMKTMIKYSFRRLPITDPGTKRLEGIITGMDIVNFLGGGEKHKIVEGRYNNNLLAAVNEEVKEIMEKDVVAIDFTSSWEDALEVLLERGVGGAPIIDREDTVIGIITERDIMKFLAERREYDGVVEDYMTRGVITAEPNTKIEEAMKTMVSKKIRRLPVVKDGLLVGILTSTTIVHYFAGEVFKELVTGNAKEALERPISAILSNKKILKYTEPLVVSPRTSLRDVVNLMLEKNQAAALVVSSGNLEGIITERDLMKFLCEAKC